MFTAILLIKIQGTRGIGKNYTTVCMKSTSNGRVISRHKPMPNSCISCRTSYTIGARFFEGIRVQYGRSLLKINTVMG